MSKHFDGADSGSTPFETITVSAGPAQGVNAVRLSKERQQLIALALDLLQIRSIGEDKIGDAKLLVFA